MTGRRDLTPGPSPWGEGSYSGAAYWLSKVKAKN